ncbi:MAG: flagellar hook-associated protein FlgK [Sphingobium sp.]
MSVSDLLSIGASGTRAYRAAMGAVSENITNATTEGYNRRAVILSESAASSATSIMYKPGVAFGGVDVGSVVRRTDEYLDLAARLSGGKYADADTRATWLGNVQSALDDGALGVGKQMTTMFSAVEQLAANPSDTTRRTNVLFAIEQVNVSFKQTSDALKNVKDGLLIEANNEVTTLNSAVQRLASTNEALRRAVPGTSNQAQLLDQRDQALVDISKRLNVGVTYGANGIANVTYDGKAVVDNIDPSKFGVSANSDGTLAFTIANSAVAVPDSGSLGGLTSSAEVAAKRVTQVNDLAAKYVADMNAWHQGGYVSVNTTGALDGNGVLIPDVPGAPILTGTDAASLHLQINDPAKIATYSKDTSTTPATVKVNGNLVDITDIRGSGGMEDGWTAIISAQANLVATTNAEQSAMSLRDQQAQAAKADVSGVDLDREAADLMRLQQAYQGCARIIQVARESLDAIFAIF